MPRHQNSKNDRIDPDSTMAVASLSISLSCASCRICSSIHELVCWVNLFMQSFTVASPFVYYRYPPGLLEVSTYLFNRYYPPLTDVDHKVMMYCISICLVLVLLVDPGFAEIAIAAVLS